MAWPCNSPLPRLTGLLPWQAGRMLRRQQGLVTQVHRKVRQRRHHQRRVARLVHLRHPRGNWCARLRHSHPKSSSATPPSPRACGSSPALPQAAKPRRCQPRRSQLPQRPPLGQTTLRHPSSPLGALRRPPSVTLRPAAPRSTRQCTRRSPAHLRRRRGRRRSNRRQQLRRRHCASRAGALPSQMRRRSSSPGRRPLRRPQRTQGIATWQRQRQAVQQSVVLSPLISRCQLGRARRLSQRQHQRVARSSPYQQWRRIRMARLS